MARIGIVWPHQGIGSVRNHGASFQAAEELVAALRAGDVTSAALTDEVIDRIERDDTAINEMCVPDFDRARAAARGADEAIARGEKRPIVDELTVTCPR